MRPVFVLALAGGCYAPRAPAGAPCDPAAPRCPDGQVCRQEASGFTCGDPIDLVPDAPVPVDAAIDAPPEPPPDAPPAARFEYPAKVAECLDPRAPSPLECRLENGNDQMVVDALDTTEEVEWRAYVRFDLDDRLAGRTVTKLTLRVVATADADADGSEAGEVWRVTPFSVVSLMGMTPARIDGDPIAVSTEDVEQLQPIAWELPPVIVAANAPLYLEIATTSEGGVNYWNTDGPDPPVLIVDVE